MANIDDAVTVAVILSFQCPRGICYRRISQCCFKQYVLLFIPHLCDYIITQGENKQVDYAIAVHLALIDCK